METGFWIWKIKDIYRGDPLKIAAAAKAAGLHDVYIKVADGIYRYNRIVENGKVVGDRLPALVAALKALKIKVWGWHYVYGYAPEKEAQMSAKCIKDFGLDGFVVDAEAEFKQAGWGTRADRYFIALKEAGIGDCDLAYSSYRYPDYHPEFPWAVFEKHCQWNMPQVYWEKAHNPALQLQNSVRDFSGFANHLPILPVGPTYSVSGWVPTPGDIHAFIQEAIRLNIHKVSFFSWDEAERAPGTWEAVASYKPVVAETPVTVPLARVEEKLDAIQQSVRTLGEGVVELKKVLSEEGLI